MIVRTLCIVIAGSILAGCQNGKMLTSIPGGEAKVFEAPPYAVRGVTTYDQGWIDSQIEGGVAAFGWPRPAARPASLDKQPALRLAARLKKRGIVKRIKDRIVGAKPEPVEYLPLAAPAVQPAPAPPPPPRDRVDELLRPLEPGTVYPK